MAADMTTAVDTRRTVAITLLRAGAAVLICYGFLVGLWAAEHGANPWWLANMREWVNRPLRLGEDFGPLGLMLLVLCAGYAADGRITRLVRLYLPVLAATLLAVVLVPLGAEVWTTPDDASVRPSNVVANLTLLSHVVDDKTLLVPLAWVAGVLAVAVLAAVGERGIAGWLVPAGVLAAVVVLCLVARADGRLAIPLTYVPLAVFGLAARRAGTAFPRWVGLVLMVAAFGALLGVDQAFPDGAGNWYPVAAGYAVLLFLTAVLVAGPVADATSRLVAVRWLDERVEWLVPLTGVVGFPVLGLLAGPVGFTAAAVVALAATGLVADLGYRLTRRLP
jgi:hypothetical protein